jgi:hypothetical protein
MRSLIITTFAASLLGATAAMAQTVPPAPNASGSQVTSPASKGVTANEALGRTDTGSNRVMVPGAAGTVAPTPNASGSQATNPGGSGQTANEALGRTGTGVNSTGSIAPMNPGTVAPSPNASGSLVTNPAGTK